MLIINGKYLITCASIYCASDQVTNHEIDQKLPESTGHLKTFLCQKKYMY